MLQGAALDVDGIGVALRVGLRHAARLLHPWAQGVAALMAHLHVLLGLDPEFSRGPGFLVVVYRIAAPEFRMRRGAPDPAVRLDPNHARVLARELMRDHEVLILLVAHVLARGPLGDAEQILRTLRCAHQTPFLVRNFAYSSNQRRSSLRSLRQPRRRNSWRSCSGTMPT